MYYSASLMERYGFNRLHRLNKGILSYDRDLLVYVVIVFDKDALTGTSRHSGKHQTVLALGKRRAHLSSERRRTGAIYSSLLSPLVSVYERDRAFFFKPATILSPFTTEHLPGYYCSRSFIRVNHLLSGACLMPSYRPVRGLDTI